MAFPAYKALVFPHSTGGGPGPTEVVVLTVTANDGSPISNPVASVATPALYQAAGATAKTAHETFSDLVMYFRAYGQPVKVASTGTTITLTYELPAMWSDSSLGTPAWRNAGTPRPDAYELAQAYVAANSFNVTVITTTVNGSSQSS